LAAPALLLESTIMKVDPGVFRKQIDELVQGYMAERARIRSGIQQSIIAICQQEGVPIPEGEAMEAAIDAIMDGEEEGA